MDKNQPENPFSPRKNRVEPAQPELWKNKVLWETICIGSGSRQVARGGSGAEAPPNCRAPVLAGSESTITEITVYTIVA